jgi:hypothetical protein
MHINVFDPNEFFIDARQNVYNKFGLALDSNATHAYLSLLPLFYSSTEM